jgi:antirestriction protein ArdC
LASRRSFAPDHASYIANWLSVLKSDKKAIFTAASKAQQAANYLTVLAGERP